jgi:hypothetical protein
MLDLVAHGEAFLGAMNHPEGGTWQPMIVYPDFGTVIITGSDFHSRLWGALSPLALGLVDRADICVDGREHSTEVACPDGPCGACHQTGTIAMGKDIFTVYSISPDGLELWAADHHMTDSGVRELDGWKQWDMMSSAVMDVTVRKALRMHERQLITEPDRLSVLLGVLQSDGYQVAQWS